MTDDADVNCKQADESMEEDEISSSSEDEEIADGKPVVPSKAYLPGNALEQGEELVMDEQAYLLYHQATLGPPCLSFDLVPDDLGWERETTCPVTLYGVAGTQAETSHANGILVFKMNNLHPIKREKVKNPDASSDESDEEDSDDQDSESDKEPKLKVAGIQHTGCVNRLKFQTLGATSVVAAWSELGSVGIWSMDRSLQKLEEPSGGKDLHFKDKARPLQQFKGHLSEGFSLAWSPTSLGVLASGDCKKNIYVWKPTDAGNWEVSDSPYEGHTDSVEDIQWSPTEANVMASCSVDESIRIWDCRAPPNRACMLTAANSHESDVNVIDWNRNEPFIVSGGDDGRIKVWDLRVFDRGDPVAVFHHHKGPVTSVEWNPVDATVLASSGQDDQVSLWDLALEKDPEESGSQDAEELDNLPPQLLFIHQGLHDVKEVHWHRQLPGLVVCTSHSGFDVFRTISV